MTIKVRIVCETGVVSLKDAIEKNVIDYENNMITAKKGTSVCLASGLLDNNGKEIFEKDVLSDSSGRLFQVQYMRGAFFAISLDHNDQKAIPLFFLEINGIIPAIIVDGL